VSERASGGDIFKPEKQCSAWPEGYGRLVFESLDSTLSEAARRAADLTGPLWILADEQTAARGRRGRSWATPKGNFASALIMRRTEAPGIAALRSFVASLALRRAFVRVTGDDGAFALKWPNDVLLNGGKVAGILLENIGDHLAIGIGVNLAHAPGADQVEAGALRPVSIVGETGLVITTAKFLDALAIEYALLETQFTTFGFASIRTAWLAHAARLGEEIVARTMRDETRGIFEDVDELGCLILRTPKGRVAITAADVFFLRLWRGPFDAFGDRLRKYEYCLFDLGRHQVHRNMAHINRMAAHGRPVLCVAEHLDAVPEGRGGYHGCDHQLDRATRGF